MRIKERRPDVHTSDILRSNQFRVVDQQGAEVSLTADLTSADRLGVVSPRYEDAILGAGAAILTFVTAFYDLQRARQQETGESFFIYADYFVFFFGENQQVRGQANPAPLEGDVSSAYGWLDVWPHEKWVIVRDAADLWAQVQARGITHLLLPAHPAINLGAAPPAVAAKLKATYRYLLPDERDGDQALRIELAAEPREIVVEAVRRLPAESPAHSVELPAYQRLLSAASSQ